jgi:hypothetical protein
MALKLSAIPPHFWTTAKLSLPGDLGKRIEVEFRIKVARLSQDDYVDLAVHRRMPGYEQARKAVEAANQVAKLAALAAGNPAPEPRPLPEPVPVDDKKVVDLVLLGWGDVLDDADQALPFTPENLERVDQLLGVRAATVDAFFAAHLQAPEKNSEPQPAMSTGT